MRLRYVRLELLTGDILGQEPILFFREEYHIPDRFLPIKMCDHQVGMYAGIGPAGPHNRHGRTHQDGQGLLYRLLHRHTIRLDLPAAVIRPVICYKDSDSSHDIFLSFHVIISRNKSGTEFSPSHFLMHNCRLSSKISIYAVVQIFRLKQREPHTQLQ